MSSFLVFLLNPIHIIFFLRVSVSAILSLYTCHLLLPHNCPLAFIDSPAFVGMNTALLENRFPLVLSHIVFRAVF